MGPPSETPISTACCDPTASITARTSSILVSSVGTSVTRSDTPVEPDHARERSEASQPRRDGGLQPGVLHVRDHPGDKDEVRRTFAQGLVRDADLATPGVARLRHFHKDSFRPRLAGGKLPAGRPGSRGNALERAIAFWC
jgi:hypothetical protein